MKVKLILELDGDFKDSLLDEEVEGLLKIVIGDGAKMYHLSSSFEVLEIIMRPSVVPMRG